MLYSRLRYALIFLVLTLGLILHWQLGFANAWYMYVAGVVLLATHFLFGSVWTAFRVLKKGRPLEAEQILGFTQFPELLMRRNRAYYHFTYGMIELQRKALSRAENHLKKAIDLKLDSANDRALAALNLAHLYFVQKNPNDCHHYLQQAKQEKASDLMIKDQIEKLETATGLSTNGFKQPPR
ncbi:MAG: hypothetical protein DHS20C18_52320 [Saprospiraceae bacterium]|nr:MAG: hypothetical protein DHS20C18_52320 [Saprospiraceae bacterium]